jgi:tRNA dimethylallyltransferase
MRRILVLVGPTASGKTDISLVLAEMLNGEILSADSRQVYKFLDIGTAKPTREQRARIRHYFVDELTPDQEFSAGEFGARGREAIDEIFRRGKVPIVVGGSGLYVQSLTDGIFEGPGADKDIREILERRLQAEGIAGLLAELRTVDPQIAERIDPTKPRRIIRALEVFHITGRPLSKLHQESAPTIDFVVERFGLLWERKALYARIEKRCDAMLENGLLEEVESLERRGYTDRLNALNTVGYAEAFAYRRGEIGYEEMVRMLKQNSRRYAKRQMTWFRRDERIEWVSAGEPLVASAIAEAIAAKFVR